MSSDSKVRSQVGEILQRFNDLVSRRDPQVMAEFAPVDEIILVGSETGEVANGRHEIQVFFERVFAREGIFSWEWDRVEAWGEGDLAWFFAEGWAIYATTKEQRKMPYRVSGVLERYGERWLWRQYHGSEPVRNE